MKRLRAWALLVMLLPAPSRALELRRVGELRLGSGGFVEWVDAHRYVRMKNEFERTPRGAIRGITFVVADVREGKILRLPLALDELHRSHPSLFTGAPNAELVHFDGATALLRFDRREPARTVFHYAAWNPRTKALSEPRYEDAEIVRIDLEAGRVDRRVKAQPHIQGFATTASGDALLVMSDHIGAPRSIEVRRWSDLSLRETIPFSRLFPGVAGLHPSGIQATPDGRLVVAPRYKPDGYPDSSDAGLVTFAVEEGTTAARPDPTAAVREHVERARVRLYDWQLQQVGNAEGHFAPMVANDRGESFVIGTRSDLPEDAPYEPGKSHPYAIWVDAKGKVVWERSLRSGTTFLDYEGGSAVATPDGGFIAFLLCYVKPGANAASRLVKLDREGRVVWEWTGPLGKESRFPDRLQLLASGVVLMKGHLGTSRAPWVGALDARTGKLLRDEVGGPP